MSSCNKPGSLKAALMILCSEVPILTCTKLKTITDAMCSVLKVGWRRVKLLSPSILFDAHFQEGFLESSWNSVVCLWNIGRLVYLWRTWISDIWAPYNPINQVPIFLCSPSTPCLVTPPMQNIWGSRLYNKAPLIRSSNISSGVLQVLFAQEFWLLFIGMQIRLLDMVESDSSFSSLVKFEMKKIQNCMCKKTFPNTWEVRASGHRLICVEPHVRS